MRASIQLGQECGPGNPDAPTEDIQAGLGLGASEERGSGPLQGVLLILCSASLPHSWSLLILCQGLGPALLSSFLPIAHSALTVTQPSSAQSAGHSAGHSAGQPCWVPSPPTPRHPMLLDVSSCTSDSAPSHTHFSVKPSHFCPL